jgi:hypothetical protein
MRTATSDLTHDGQGWRLFFNMRVQSGRVAERLCGAARWRGEKRPSTLIWQGQLGDISGAGQWTEKTAAHRMYSFKRRPVRWSDVHAARDQRCAACDARLLRAKSEEVRSRSGGFSLGMRLLALRFEPMVDLALRRV